MKLECDYCGEEKEDVCERPNWFAQELQDAPDAIHFVCDYCQEQSIDGI